MKKKHFLSIPGLYWLRESKLGMKMRATIIVLLICIGQTFAVDSYAQNTGLSLKMSNVTIETVLEAIENQSDFYFMYEAHNVNVDKKVSVSASNETVQEILDDLFTNSNVTYKINDRQIALSTIDLSLIGQQSLKISGKVTDASGSPLPGVTVVVKGTTNGTITDFSGNYSLDVPANAIMQYSFVGMKMQEIEVGTKTIINVSLAEDAIGIEEVVAVGYGTMRKSDLTGSVSSIKSEQLKKLPMTSFDQGIQGQAAGVQVTTTSGAPGGQVSIRVRGGNSLKSSNEPLYVVDGFPLSAGSMAEGGINSSSLASNPLATINPSDIESIEILKDASAAAIYGSRGANGVVLITTKRGKSGKTKVSYEGYLGVQNVASKLDFMNAEEYAIMANEGAANEGRSVIYGGSAPQWESPENYRNKSVDWQDLIFRIARTTNHQVALTGGSDKTQFAISANLFNQDGVVINSDFNRGSVRANVDTELSSWVKAGLSFTASRSMSSIASSEGDGGGTTSGAINGAIVMPPTMPVYNEDGSFTTLALAPYSSAIGNPYANATLTKDQAVVDRVLANLFVKFDLNMFLPGLSLDIRGGTDYSNAFRDQYWPSTVLTGESKKGVAAKSFNRSSSLLNENLLNYKNKFGKHSFNVLAGLTVQYFEGSGSRTTVAGFVNDALGYNNLGAASNIDGMPTSWKGTSTQVSWLGRFNYNYDNRYLITLTGRADGSSKFGINNKWGFFPSVALAWRMSEESFMDDVSGIDNLKVRLSYGSTGNQNLGSYMSMSSLGQYSYNFGGYKATGFADNKIPNSDLKWETTTTFDAGMDIGFLDNRLNLIVDYYNKQTTNLLWDVTIPSSTGFSTIFKNHGELSNWGIEASLSYLLVANEKPGAFTWNSSLMYSMNRNKIESMPGITPGRTGNLSGHLKVDGSWLEEGYPIGIWQNYVYDGVFQNQEQLDATIVNENGETVPMHPKSINTDGLGSPKFVDTNKDGKIDKNDWQVIGDPNPDFIMSWNNTFAYKNFDLTIFVNGVQGNDIMDLTRAESAVVTPFANQRREMLDRWTPTNSDSNIPAARVAIHPLLLQSSYLVQDGSFVRLKNVVLGYRFPVKRGIESLRVYVSAQNLLTFTNYKGFDPEVNSMGQSNLQLGIDYNAYPVSRVYTIGLNMTL